MTTKRRGVKNSKMLEKEVVDPKATRKGVFQANIRWDEKGSLFNGNV